ncbi:hypothetical protein Ssi03_50430 [Sphaerisporangium siamense]|uniref:Uncharacterized protein n=1 Tax=Sphaerisporangium siamense TaxID=795645 RepID=A0A7W7D8H8_9ACTN|nr:hypothetical protein [Sphaerisporangium siamense]MBB4702253.1 hypothetical protein [Sphaerisporangium siamense]GII87053.1 hypothetical protein Ssi03_50430 [Sphaerisporangium siamense]
MAITTEGWFVDTQVKIATNAIALNLGDTTPGMFKFALFLDTITPNFSQANPAYGSAPFNSGEASGAGYTAEGIALSGVVYEEHPSAAGWVRWDFNNLSWAGSTITGAKAGLIHVPSLSYRAVLLRTFGQAYSTNDGTFGINLPSDGVAKSRVITA